MRRAPPPPPQPRRAGTAGPPRGGPGPGDLGGPEALRMQREEADSAAVWSSEEHPSVTRQPADPALVRRAAQMLIDAALPLIHCGGGTQRAGAGEEARALAEYLGWPVTTGAGSRGIVAA